MARQVSFLRPFLTLTGGVAKLYFNICHRQAYTNNDGKSAFPLTFQQTSCLFLRQLLSIVATPKFCHHLIYDYSDNHCTWLLCLADI